MEFDLSYYTHQGQRTNNEDYASFKKINNSLLAVVADGLGGHKNGEAASRFVVHSLIQALDSCPFEDDQLISAIQKASSLIQEEEQCGLSTVAALWIKDGYAFAAHVGDTRIYQFRNDQIIFQTKDHSVVQIGVLTGRITPEEARNHKDRNKLLRALGNCELPKVDCSTLSIQSGDRFLLCTDGLWEAVNKAQMHSELLSSSNSKSWLCRLYRLVEQYNNPRQDNHTAISIFIN